MPQDSDEQPIPPESAPSTPPDMPSDAPAVEAGGAAETESGTEPTGDAPRKRRRRRRRKPAPAGGESGAAGDTPPAEAGAEAETSDAETAAPGGEAGEAAPSPAAPGEAPRKRPRRRRRRKPPVTGAVEGQGGEPVAAGQATPGTGDPATPRPRGRGDGRPREARPRQPESAARPPREERAPREGAPRDRDGRDRRPREGGPRGPGKRPFGGRDAPRKPEPKLISFESMIDRGFEEVPDEANEGATRRIDWTITKRTVADQKSAKMVSAVYRLKRDGAETDFANLAAARGAVNKTISHPEKLTKAKADYGSSKK